ncbi:MAG: type methionyl aminopeptidase [Vampirovibrio sp.]|jgi:methionyl aminopeptidase|nr:type methionyl aminopeptidase [Vampirovibrio sp.]
MSSERIDRKSRHEISLIRAAAKINAETHVMVRDAIRPGISTQELNDIAEAHIRKSGGIPTFKGLYGFPATLCISVNDEVVHGIPNPNKILQDGDVVSIDCGTTYKGMVSDSAVTWAVGTISKDLEQLLKATEEGLLAGIAQMVPGNYLEDISGAIEDVCLKYGYGMVRNYGGHGVGRKPHEAPFIHNFRTGERGPRLEEGNVLAIEPMFNLGGDDVYTAEDEWTVITKDHLPSAHFEHTVVVTKGEPEILTLLP